MNEYLLHKLIENGNKMIGTSVNKLKFDFGEGVFGEVSLKIPIVKRDPDPIKIISSNLF